MHDGQRIHVSEWSLSTNRAIHVFSQPHPPKPAEDEVRAPRDNDNHRQLKSSDNTSVWGVRLERKNRQSAHHLKVRGAVVHLNVCARCPRAAILPLWRIPIPPGDSHTSRPGPVATIINRRTRGLRTLQCAHAHNAVTPLGVYSNVRSQVGHLPLELR